MAADRNARLMESAILQDTALGASFLNRDLETEINSTRPIYLVVRPPNVTPAGGQSANITCRPSDRLLPAESFLSLYQYWNCQRLPGRMVPRFARAVLSMG